MTGVGLNERRIHPKGEDRAHKRLNSIRQRRLTGRHQSLDQLNYVTAPDPGKRPALPARQNMHVPQVEKYKDLLPKVGCADDERCAPCISPLDNKPTGACSLDDSKGRLAMINAERLAPLPPEAANLVKSNEPESLHELRAALDAILAGGT